MAMTRARKRPPIDEDWGRFAFCKGKDWNLWDLDQDPTVWRKGRRMCIRDCPVREACLRKALQRQEGIGTDTYGVIRGGVLFDTVQRRRKKSECSLCGYPVAPMKFDPDTNAKLKNLCWICRRYTPCLKGCGRMVKRRPGIGSYHCKYCSE